MVFILDMMNQKNFLGYWIKEFFGMPLQICIFPFDLQISTLQMVYGYNELHFIFRNHAAITIFRFNLIFRKTTMRRSRKDVLIVPFLDLLIKC